MTPEEKREYKKRWYIKHKELTKVRAKTWYILHKDAHGNSVKKWNMIHREVCNASYRKWRKNNLEKEKERTQKWCNEHKEHLRELTKKWKTEHPECNRITHARRNRELGFIPLNEFFLNSNAHHVDANFVIYIPMGMHKRVWHRQNDSKSMRIINQISWDFLEFSVL